tara:strand:+ start:59 stop:1273 length:1215 start_codon:yes stop_codon:yes gene_type:complete
MPSKKRKKYYSILLFTLIAISIIFTDFLLTNSYHWIKRNSSNKQSHAGEHLGINNKYYHHDFKKNSKFESKDYSVYTNSLGFKDSHIRDIRLSSDQYRVLFIGDSFTEGVTLDWKDTFVGMISDSLKKLGIEVLNAGRSSYSTILYWRKIEYLKESLGLKFDELIVFIDVSDLEDERWYIEYAENSDYKIYEKNEIQKKKRNNSNNSQSIFNTIIKFLRNNFIFTYHFLDLANDLFLFHQPGKEISLLKKWEPLCWQLNFFRSNWPLHLSENRPINLYKEKNTRKIWGEKIEVGLELMNLSMQNLVKICIKHDIKLTIAVYPHPAQIIHNDYDSFHVKKWKNFSDNNNIQFFNFFPSFFKPDLKREKSIEIINKYYKKNDYHFNILGNKVIARNFLDFYLSKKE